MRLNSTRTAKATGMNIVSSIHLRSPRRFEPAFRAVMPAHAARAPVVPSTLDAAARTSVTHTRRARATLARCASTGTIKSRFELGSAS